MPDVFFCEIIEKILLIDNVISMTVIGNEIANEAVAGQFLHIKCGESRILRRPISICRVNDDKVNFVFEVKGEGTRWLSEQEPGQILNILGPLGNGFTIPEGKIITVGGGVGTPPMLFTAEFANSVESANSVELAKNKVTAILGFRSADRIMLTNEFKSVCNEVFITTDDGSAGIHGSVTKPLENLLQTGEYTAVMSCGQLLMQKAVAEICKKYNVQSQVSLEERMGCGIGACLVCACETISENGTLTMSRACLDGPVFNADNVVW